jgi:hypothetical protein
MAQRQLLQAASGVALLSAGLLAGNLLKNSNSAPLAPTPKLVQGQVFGPDGVPLGRVGVRVEIPGQPPTQVETDPQGWYAVTFTAPLIRVVPLAPSGHYQPLYLGNSTQVDFRATR